MENTTRQIISILVNNQPGVLSRIAGLFSRRGYNIDGLTVCATEDERWSRMTITVNATQSTVKQIVAQLEKQEDVVKVMDFNSASVAARELLLIKIAVGGARRSEIVDLCTLFGAKAIDVNADSMMLELTGSTDKVDNFVKTLSAYDITEMARTGGAALERGAGSLAKSI
ncbi:MAG TPA: acetolactate synthase small subunit [Candidatus Limadaptatus stercorigallinarum]|uniref:Acetolactate synthase small subunit n=1 Tax=Candidatus Limadaptatus stercorigallinarum TaxID=2840845 RepID=A0A9D1L1S8_9FIRM|nr:acetolactate synthase small subunit [Christensenellales bacterium]HIU21804.1 acetolactate synthase small subunit [Candidatus Limadaptatus stercorigallinarum]